MSDDKDYKSPVAETVEATGNFINSVKNPGFIIILVLIIGGGFLAYKYFDILMDIKLAIVEQNDLVIKQNVLLNQQTEATKKISDNQQYFDMPIRKHR